ncbi:MAG TPA: hypothetical protein VIS99_01150 [Terrimicrobiaceae bacterium]
MKGITAGVRDTYKVNEGTSITLIEIAAIWRTVSNRLPSWKIAGAWLLRTVFSKIYSSARGSLRSAIRAMFFFHGIWLTFLTCEISLAEEGRSGKLTLKSGSVIDYSDARIEGEEVILKLPYGLMRIRVSTVSETSLRGIPRRPGAAVAAATPAATKTPVSKPQQSPAPPSKPQSTPTPTAKVQDSPTPVPTPTPPQLPTLRAGEKLATFEEGGASSGSASPAEPEDNPLLRLSDAPAISEKPAVPVDLISMQQTWKHLPKALPPMPRELHRTQKFATKEFNFQLVSKLYGNPQVKILCKIPIDAEGKPLKSASDVVFYAPFINQKYFFLDRWPRDLAELYGMTVFSMLIETDETDVENHQKCFYYPESGSFELVLRAWERIVDELSMPRKNLLVATQSGGASMAERFAIEYPDLVDAVVLMGGWRYKAISQPNTIAWCVLHTRGDFRKEANNDLVACCRSMGLNVLEAATPIRATTKEDFSHQHTDRNFHHTPGDAAFDIGIQFLAAIRDLRNTQADWKDASRWPLRAPVAFPWAIEKNAGSLPPFGEAVYFPSKDLATVWLRNRYRYVEIPSAGNGSLTVLVCYPEKDPRGIIIYGGDGPDAENGDDMDFLASQGFIVVGQETTGDAEDSLGIFQWVTSLKQWKSLSIFALGFNDAGRDFLALLPKEDSARVKSAVAVDSSLLYPDEDLSPLKALKSTKQKIYVSSLDSSAATREPFQSYLAEAKQASADVSLIDPPDASTGARFELLERIAAELSP